MVTDKAREFRNLIKKYPNDLEGISFEFDIPISELEKLKKQVQLEEREKLEKEKQKIENERYKNANFKINSMRAKYNRIYLENETKSIKHEKQPENVTNLIEKVICKIEDAIKQAENDSDNIRKYAIIALGEVKKIKQYDLTLEQAEKLYTLMQTKSFDKIPERLGSTLSTNVSIERTREMIGTKLMTAISNAKDETDNIEELQKLHKKISIERERKIISACSTRNAIENKIAKARQKEASDRLRKNIPNCILQIATDLTTGRIDIDVAKQIIQDEAKSRVENSPKMIFTLTEEQQTRHIISQIKTLVSERAEEFPIDNPEEVIKNMRRLFGENISSSIQTVIDNLLARKQFEASRKLYREYILQSDEQQINKTILFNKIRNSEYGDMIFRIINMQEIDSQAVILFNRIEEEIARGRIKPRGVPLGKNKAGTKDITLADIWGEEMQK